MKNITTKKGRALMECDVNGDQEKTGDKEILLAILARNKAHVLNKYLECIDHLDYNKKKIVIYINTNNNIDNTEEILKSWAIHNTEKYKKNRNGNP